jgi:hypothetical protein
MWEARYGLPVLQRQENCFWGYLPGSVITLTPIGAPIRSDRRIGTILHDPSLDVMNPYDSTHLTNIVYISPYLP